MFMINFACGAVEPLTYTVHGNVNNICFTKFYVSGMVVD